MVPVIVMAQNRNIGAFEDAFEGFSDEVLKSLPFISTIGLDWSDAYIGKFPHFGVGLSAGFATIPTDAVEDIENIFDADILGSHTDLFEQIGIPIPAWTLEARLGGFGIPFDIGFKVGFIPEDQPESAKGFLPDNMTYDFFMIGGDVRFALLTEKKNKMDLSIGAGYYYFQSDFKYRDLMGSGTTTIDIPSFGSVEFEDPDLSFYMKTHTIEVKAQLSKKVLILNPFVGVGVGLGISEAGCGMDAPVTVNGGTIEEAQDAIDALLGSGAVDLSDSNLLVNREGRNWMCRIYGGLGVSIFVVKVDLGVSYNFISKSLGGVVNLRVQF